MAHAKTRLALAFAAIMLIGSAFAQTAPEAVDHPAVARYPGSSISFQKQQDYDEASLLRGPLVVKGNQETPNAEWLKVEGRITSTRYAFPPHQSSLQVYRYYESSLKANGFEILFKCNDLECLSGGAPSDIYLLGEKIDPTSGTPMMYYDHDRYILARRNGANMPTYVSILVGERIDQTIAFLQVAEPPQPAPAPKASVCAQLIGGWRNVDANTRSLPEVAIEGTCKPGRSDLQMHIWGKCHPKNCDWGKTPTVYDDATGQGVGETATSFEVTKIVYFLDEKGRLAIRTNTHFTDRSGRPDKEETDILEKAQGVPEKAQNVGAPQRGRLGARVRNIAEADIRRLGLNDPGGVLVLEVAPESPARSAGVKAGDVIIGFDGRMVGDTRELAEMAASTPINTAINIVIVRDGNEMIKVLVVTP